MTLVPVDMISIKAMRGQAIMSHLDDEVEQRYSINTGTWKQGFLLASLECRFSDAILFISDVI